MKVAVLGASGGMGSFFARYFLEKGETVIGSDSGKGRKQPLPRVEVRSSNAEAARGCDVTIIAVPMDSTLKVAKEIAGKLKPGSTLVEISSVKGETLPALRKLVDKRVKLLSIHPLFGPALQSTWRMKIAVIVGKKGGVGAPEVALASELFPEARIIPMSQKEHDKAVAVVLSLTHLLNIVYAATASQFLSPDEFMKVATPNASMQLTLAEAVLAQDPKLSFNIQAGNVYSKRVGRAASRELKRALAILERSDWDGFAENFSKLAKRYKTDKRGGAMIKEIYSAAAKGS